MSKIDVSDPMAQQGKWIVKVEAFEEMVDIILVIYKLTISLQMCLQTFFYDFANAIFLLVYQAFKPSNVLYAGCSTSPDRDASPERYARPNANVNGIYQYKMTSIRSSPGKKSII